MTIVPTARHYLAKGPTPLLSTSDFLELEKLWERAWKEFPYVEILEGILHNFFRASREPEEVRRAIRICTKLADGHNCETYFLAASERSPVHGARIEGDISHWDRQYLADRAWKELYNKILVPNKVETNWALAQLYNFDTWLTDNTVAEDLLVLFHPAPTYLTRPLDVNFRCENRADEQRAEVLRIFLRALWSQHAKPTAYMRKLRVDSIPHVIISGVLEADLAREVPQWSLEQENWPYKELFEYLERTFAKDGFARVLGGGGRAGELAGLYLRLKARLQGRTKKRSSS